ncbi:MAG: ribosome hibernation-promoting factor, HPF/YfiA family [Anaerolineae bacterium]
MDLTLHANNIRVTEDLEEFVQKKLSKFERYMPNIESVRVELSQQNSNRGPDIIVAQITVRHDRGAILRTEEKIEKQDYSSIKTAISNASDKMYRRIRRFKGKPRSKRLRERYAMTQEEFTMAEPLPDDAFPEATAEEEATLADEIVRRKVVAVSAMYEEEAIEQMELLGHTFFMFFNPDKNAINLVYKRDDGGYGVLEPEIV